VLTREDFMRDPQIQHLGMAQEIVDPKLGRTLQMGVPINLRATPGRIRGPAPVLCDSSSGACLQRGEARTSPEASPCLPVCRQPSVTSDADASGALGGRVVLDFGGYIAGPLAATALAWAGADVIKIETPQGDPFRAFGFGFYGWNQSKRGLALDFAKPEARTVLGYPPERIRRLETNGAVVTASERASER
jgi:crotonobetainyl-CoA:carnitine CoA-transferase CaiB-like acyl-CoA transferase